MSAPEGTRRYTVDDLAQFPEDGKRRELVDGRIVEWDMPTLRHAFFLVTLAAIIRAYVRERRLGIVGGGDPMVRVLGSDFHARGADIAFYARGRSLDNLDAAATDLSPDFVVEIISPSDRAGEVQLKVHDWLRAGVRLLWYVNPVTGVTTVHQGERAVFVGPDEPLSGGDVLPGFTLRMRDVLDEIAALTEGEHGAE